MSYDDLMTLRPGVSFNEQGEAQVLVCRLDRLAYPVRDDVPVMLEEEARQLGADDPLLER